MTFSVVRTLPRHDPRLGAVRSFAESLDAGARARLQVWIYDASPTVHMFQWDEYVCLPVALRHG